MLTDGRTTDGRTDDGRTTDAGVTGILIAHLGAFGSGELKMHKKSTLSGISIVWCFSSRIDQFVNTYTSVL